MSARFQKGGSAGEVWNIADNDASGTGVLDADALYCKSPLSTATHPAKLRDRWVWTFISALEMRHKSKHFSLR